MARCRNIKPGFFTNEVLGELDPLARLLFAGLWCHADREGRLEDRLKRLKPQILPFDNCDIEQLAQCLHDAKLMHRYVVDGKRYIQIIKFKEHQNPHIKEQASIIPAPDMNRTCTEVATLIPSSLIPDSLPPLNGASVKTLLPEETAITITLNDKSEYPVSKDLVKEWESLYPAVDVSQTLREIRGYFIANQAKRKTQRGILRCINGWLSREQNKG